MSKAIAHYPHSGRSSFICVMGVQELGGNDTDNMYIGPKNSTVKRTVTGERLQPRTVTANLKVSVYPFTTIRNLKVAVIGQCKAKLLLTLNVSSTR